MLSGEFLLFQAELLPLRRRSRLVPLVSGEHLLLSKLRIVIEHFFGRIDAQSPLLRKVAEILVVNEAFHCLVKVLEALELILDAHLHF